MKKERIERFKKLYPTETGIIVKETQQQTSIDFMIKFNRICQDNNKYYGYQIKQQIGKIIEEDKVKWRWTIKRSMIKDEYNIIYYVNSFNIGISRVFYNHKLTVILDSLRHNNIYLMEIQDSKVWG